MQVRLLTNIAPSKASGDRSGAADTVIRRLFDVGAVFRVENGWTGGLDRRLSSFKTNEPVLDVGFVSAKFSVLTIPPDDFTPVLWDRFVPLVFENR